MSVMAMMRWSTRATRTTTTPPLVMTLQTNFPRVETETPPPPAAVMAPRLIALLVLNYKYMCMHFHSIHTHTINNILRRKYWKSLHVAQPPPASQQPKHAAAAVCWGARLLQRG